MKIVCVALDVPLPTLFDYAASDLRDGDIGRRVLVPFGKKIAVGVIMACADSTDVEPERLRRVLSIQRDVPPLPADVRSLLKFSSDYYHHPLGEVVLNALPTRLRRRQPIKLAAKEAFGLTEAGRSIDVGSFPPRAKIRRAVLALLRNTEPAVHAARLYSLAPGARAVVNDFAKRAWIEPSAAAVTATTPTPAQRVAGPELSAQQSAVLKTVREAGEGFVPWLLRGVTGSGKTEVYLQLIADALERGKQALVLVPEINLTPQLEALIRARFPATTLIALHSGLSEGERLHGWLSAQSGEAAIVLGTRLAIFTPLPKLGLIVIDEEHDASYKQVDG
ncbi:MAG TPA: DEAD/DEAH box helicase, partial [Burkholderiales bacterium]|nr:DEAD/DEAH box helicase [Burkholderiales bacterium]